MKISIALLKNYIEIPVGPADLVDLFEDIGLEVKRQEKSGNDTVLTLELLANRGDLHAYTGIAREIYGRTRWMLKDKSRLLERPVLRTHAAGFSLIVLSDKCLAYTLTEFNLENPAAANSKLPDDYQRMLEVAGIHSINHAIDISNIINLELGQPTHVFDADKVHGEIVVRDSVYGEKAWVLFSDKAVTLPAGTLVVADSEKILAVAGVIGCEDSKVDGQTTRLLLESAVYDPVSIRMAAKSIDIQTASSSRFEKGGDIMIVGTSVARANMLLSQLGWSLQYAAPEQQWEPDPSEIDLQLDDLNASLGLTLQPVELENILSGYGFQTQIIDENEITVAVPSYRTWDVKEKQDIYEEVCRYLGYNELSSKIPEKVAIQSDPVLFNKDLTNEVLINEGFYEVFTEGFYSESHRQKLGFKEEHPAWKHVNIINSQERSYALMKNNNVVHALDLIRTNLNYKTKNIKAFEWNRTFHPAAEGSNPAPFERKVLWMVITGSSRESNWQERGRLSDAFYLKGIILEIAEQLGLSLSFKQTTSAAQDDYPITSYLLHPGRKVNIQLGEKTIGVLGEIHPGLVKTWDLKEVRPYFLEIEQSFLTAMPEPRIYKEPSNIQTIARDLTLLLPSGLAADEVRAIMISQSELISEVEITDLFNGEQTGYSNAVTFSIIFDPKRVDKTSLSSDEINRATENLFENTKSHFINHDITRR